MYLPDLPRPAYHDLLESLDQEFTYTFGGCTIVRGLDGSYLSSRGLKVQDRVNLIYTDTAFPLHENFPILNRCTDQLRAAALAALQEEAILIVPLQVYHTE